MLSAPLQSETEAVAAAALASLNAWEASEARPVVKGVCIDSSHSLDRDDAIWFEETADGRLIVDVTIADVASFITPNSPLDLRARQMTESTYGAESVIEPMLPFRLSQDDDVAGNGIFSLSDKSVRAGMTTRITLNQTKREIEQIEMFPSLIYPEIVNYAHVAESIKSDQDSRFSQWARYTALLKSVRRHHSEGVLPIAIEDEQNGTITHVSEEGHVQALPAAEAAASRMVEETSLLANRANAQFFAACSLPYLYRTHQIKLEGEGATTRGYFSLNEAEDARQALMTRATQATITLTPDRARYSAVRQPHSALGEYAYAHSTSPIRRYADIPNQRMQHWLAQTMAELNYHMGAALNDSVSPDTITQFLTKAQANPKLQEPEIGQKLIGWVGRLHMAERESVRRHCRSKVQKYLLSSLEAIAPFTPLPELYTHSQTIIRALDSRISVPPYTQSTIQQVAFDINHSQSSRTLTERERLAQKLLLTHMERELELAELQVLNALEMENHERRTAEIEAFSVEKRFPLTLHLAAQQGKEYLIPAASIQQRLNEGRLREPADLATILVQMKLPKMADAARDSRFADDASQTWLKQNCEDWVELKQQILKRFDDNPAFTKGFIKHLEERYHWQVHSTYSSLIAKGAIAATMSLNPTPDLPLSDAMAQTQFPPEFSVGHWGKTTRHHARISLLKALANNSLVSADKVKLPRALRLMTAAGYGEFLLPDARAVSLLEEKSAAVGLRISGQWDAPSQSYHLKVSSSDSKEPMQFSANGLDEPNARALAWQNLLRSKVMTPVQENLFRKREKLQAIPIDADEAIEWLGNHSTALNQHLRFTSTNQHTARREPIWQATLELTLHQAITRKFEGQSTQAEVAGTFANEAAMRYLRERADFGDSSIHEGLAAYEKEVLSRYAQGDVLSSKVPYSAVIQGREIKPNDHTPLVVKSRG